MKKMFFLIFTMVVFAMIVAGCGTSAKEKEEQEKIKEYATPIAVNFAKEFYGKVFEIDGYEFSSQSGGGVLFVRGHFEGEKPNQRTVQISYNPENYREMTADAMKKSKID
ncbi:hypothetical protein [Metabacillus mangrovi]|uniref:hypothetical protein n=1 Tax=Metabacillus mangrovi TaxID=1491830 RepID=UPI0013915198|nr:hypothetical protein [Metabacillus mangrovi]